MKKKYRPMITKVVIRFILTSLLLLFIYYIPPINPLLIIGAIVWASYVTGMWLNLFFNKKVVVVGMTYVVLILGLASYGILDLINGILIHLLLIIMLYYTYTYERQNSKVKDIL